MSESLCARCDHPLSRHCEPGTMHRDHKEESRMIDPKWCRNTRYCVSRHCLNPLCSCVDFQERAA